MTLDALCSHLLPPEEHRHFAALLLEDSHLTLLAAMTAPKAVCPDCYQPSHRMHSGYCRTLADLPWALMPVALRVHVRRFFCDTRRCERLTCTERVPLVAPLSARTTTRRSHRHADTGLALGGSAGARQLARQSIPASRSPVLRRVRQLLPPASSPPHVVGIDEWAWRTGHRYGTIVVDLERGCPIDVLEDRLAETGADWCTAHPEVQVVARDRAEASAAGIRQGAPEAVQVADRFHLFTNLAEALHEVFSAQSQDLLALHDATHPEPVRLDDDAVAVPIAPPVASPKARQQSAHKRARRLATYEHVWALPRQGWSPRAIAAHIGCARLTVQRFLRAPTFPERQPRCSRRPTVRAPCTASLLERWNAGCRNGAQLYRAIKAQGFRGQLTIVCDSVRRMRAAQRRLSPGHASPPATPLVEAATPLTPRAATWLVLRRGETLDAPEQRHRAALQRQEGEVAEAITLRQDFAALVRQRQPAQRDRWLERAARRPVQALARWASSLREDYAAGKAGGTLPWSTGPVEGQINRLKMRKRQRFGRANIALLRRRVLHPT